MRNKIEALIKGACLPDRWDALSRKVRITLCYSETGAEEMRALSELIGYHAAGNIELRSMETVEDALLWDCETTREILLCSAGSDKVLRDYLATLERAFTEAGMTADLTIVLLLPERVRDDMPLERFARAFRQTVGDKDTFLIPTILHLPTGPPETLAGAITCLAGSPEEWHATGTFTVKRYPFATIRYQDTHRCERLLRQAFLRMIRSRCAASFYCFSEGWRTECSDLWGLLGMLGLDRPAELETMSEMALFCAHPVSKDVWDGRVPPPIPSEDEGIAPTAAYVLQMIPPERLMACFGAAMTCLPDSLSSDMLSMVISQRIEKLFSHPHAIWRALHEAYDKALDTRTAAAVIEGWRDAILSAADCLDDGAPPHGPVDEVADRMRAVTDQCGAGVNDAARYLAAHASAMREDAAFCRDVRVLSGVDDERYGDFRFSVILHGKEDHHGD